MVSKVHDYGCFVSLEGFKGRKEGLVHISNMKDTRVINAFEVVKKNQKVKVKVISVVSKKIGLSMKDVDQVTGQEIVKKPKLKQSNLDEERGNQNDENKPKKLFGTLTGIKLEVDVVDLKKKSKKRQGSPALWEKSR